MLFFDKKEEVLDIKLTPHGRKLLSEGTFKPVYYAFFDDNILYDGNYASISEAQNNIDSRIRDNAPQPKTQIKFASEVKDGSGKKEVEKLNFSLGNSSNNSELYPAFNVKVYNGEISSSVDLTYRENSGQVIPQIDVTVLSKVHINSIDKPQTYGDSLVVSLAAGDGTFLAVEPEYFLAQIIEKHVDFDMENFDMEVFKIKDKDTPSEEKIPLKFAINQRKNIISNGVLLDEREDVFETEGLTPEDVEYYFRVRYDQNIDPNILRTKIGESKSRNIYTDSSTTSEKSERSLSVTDIYGTTTTESDIVDCE